jgi:PAS domain S-box-containing protein
MPRRRGPLPSPAAPAPAATPDELAIELDRLRSIVEHLRTENEHLLESQPVLEASRDDYVELFESAPLGTLVTDEHGTIRSANQAAAALLGRTAATLVGRGFTQLVALADRPVVAAHFARCGRQEGSLCCEVRLASAVEDAPLVQLWSRRSSRRRPFLQTTLFDLNARERERVEKVELLEAMRSAQKASHAKDKFIAMLSHELRTPLTPVLVAASALQAQPDLPTRVRETFAMIVRNVELEARLVDDLLDVTRIAQGKMHAERTPTELHPLIQRVCESLREELARRQQRISVDLKAERSRALVDPTRMQQLFGNLLRNALKFTPAGGEILVGSWNRDGTLVVEVEDNGIGLEAAELTRIFEPFSQVEPSEPPAGGISRTSEGLGLGLAICKGITDLHGGTLEAQSLGRGRGSRFIVQLPTTTLPVASAEVRVAASPERAAVPAKLVDGNGKARILLVEDHVDTAEMVAELLVDEGFEVDKASTVRDALAVDLQNVDVIVSDLGLPDGDGLDLIRQLLRSGHRPAIALSGFGMGTDVQASMEAGFDVHLTKPVDFDKLIQTIRTLGTRRP